MAARISANAIYRSLRLRNQDKEHLARLMAASSQSAIEAHRTFVSLEHEAKRLKDKKAGSDLVGVGAFLSDGLERLDDLSHRLLSRSNEYDRAMDTVRATAASATEAGTDIFRLELGAFLSAGRAAILKDLEEEAGAFTGLTDLFKRVAGHQPLVQSIIDRHVGKAQFDQANDIAFAKMTLVVSARWEECAGQIHRRLVETGRPHGLVPVSKNGAPARLRQAELVGLLGLGSSAVGTLVLAAGWHTLAWSVGGLFLPSLPVVALVYVVWAFIRKGAERQKLESEIEGHLDSMQELVQDRIETSIAHKLQEENREAVSRSAAHLALAIAQVDKIEDLHWLVDHTHRLRGQLEGFLQHPAFRDLQIGLAPMSLVRRARQAGDRDPLCAALFASSALEVGVHQLARRHGVMSGSLHNMIEALGRGGYIARDKLRLIDDMRRRRNEYIHGVHTLALQAPSALSQESNDFVDKVADCLLALG